MRTVNSKVFLCLGLRLTELLLVFCEFVTDCNAAVWSFTFADRIVFMVDKCALGSIRLNRI